jgi:hypothetical protein
MNRCREIEPPMKKRRLESRETEESASASTSNLHTSLLMAASLKRRRSLVSIYELWIFNRI